jgi:hypothetical protein
MIVILIDFNRAIPWSVLFCLRIELQAIRNLIQLVEDSCGLSDRQ